jgi:hypothetical protein
MNAVLMRFEERKQEIELYFEHVSDFLDKDAIVLFPDHQVKSLSIDLEHILLSNLFLLLYNLVESSISGAVESIYKEMLANAVAYDAIQPTIQIEILDNVRKNVNTKKFVDTVDDLVIDILKYYPKSTELFSGNVDQEEIKKIAQKYGFSAHTDARKTRNGEKLKIIKNRRNELAHGFRSFQECGEERTFQEMKAIKDECLLYIEQILKNIDSFLKNKDYLKSDKK